MQMHFYATEYGLYNSTSKVVMNRYIALILLGVMGMCVASAQNPADSVVVPFCISDGHFFSKENFRDVTPGSSSLTLLEDSEGNRIMGVYLPDGFVLDEAIVAKAISADRVRHAERLLEDYERRRPASISKYAGVGVKAGEPFISFDYIDTDNRVWNNDVLKGKVYVINVWQKECGPCRREMPVLSTWKEKYPDVIFLSASRHDTREITPIVQQHDFTWTHLQEASDIVALTGQQGFPLTVVVDNRGIVRFAKTGASEEIRAEALDMIEQLSK